MQGRTSLKDQAGQRCQGYWLLSRLFLEVPTFDFLSEISQLLVAQVDLAPSEEIANLCHAIRQALADPDEACAAYTRHLVLGDKERSEPLPFEAHVRERQLPGECTSQVGEMMAEAGFGDVAPSASSVDHLGAELRFMALLCLREHDSWLAKDDSAAIGALDWQHRFLTNHIAQWVPGYCRGLAERTTNPYLRAIAMLGAMTVADDVAVLNEICRWVSPSELQAAQLSATTAPLGLHAAAP